MRSLNTAKKYVALLGFVLACASQPAFARVLAPPEPKETPEHGKINTSDASPVDPGCYETEVVYSFGTTDKAWSNNGNKNAHGFTSEHSAAFSATAGISKNFDVTINLNHSWLKDKDNDFDDDGTPGPVSGNGFGDVEASARYRFIQDKKLNLDVAYIIGLIIPSGTSSDQDEMGISQEYWSFKQTLVASKDWGKWTANADLGIALPFGDKRGDARVLLNADVAAGYQVLSWLQPELELNYNYDVIENTGDPETFAVTAGLVMPVSETVRINVGAQQGIAGRNADQMTTLFAAVKIAY
ncbi:MAG: transporter [Bdellovibrionales bacterium]